MRRFTPLFLTVCMLLGVLACCAGCTSDDPGISDERADAGSGISFSDGSPRVREPLTGNADSGPERPEAGNAAVDANSDQSGSSNDQGSDGQGNADQGSADPDQGSQVSDQGALHPDLGVDGPRQDCIPTSQQDCETTLLGVCAEGRQTCELIAGSHWGWSSCVANIEPGSQVEVCGGTADEDCDGKLPQADTDCHCKNGVRDADEADTDCGGSCQPCGASSLCREDRDCASSRCQPPTVSGGCEQSEEVTRLYAIKDSLTVGCQRLWDDSGTEEQRKLAISGVTLAGGCSASERPRGLTMLQGKLKLDCEGIWDDRRQLRDIVLSGATLSGQCQAHETPGWLTLKGQEILLSCRETWGETTSLRRIALTGPRTCQ